MLLRTSQETIPLDLEMRLTFCGRPSHAQHQDLHGYCALAILLSINVRDDTSVVGEMCGLRHG